MNEFKVKKGLVINGSGSALLEAQGSAGQLSTITDSLSGSLFSVNDISGIPVLEAFSDATVKIGAFGVEAIKVSGSFATVTGSLRGTASYTTNALSSSYSLSSSFSSTASYAVTIFPFTGAAQINGLLTVNSSTGNTLFSSNADTLIVTGSTLITGSLSVTGSALITGSLGVTGSIGFSYLSPIGTWTVGGAMISGRGRLAGVGTSTSALGFGGAINSPSAVGCTEAYNGTSWTVRNAMIVGRQFVGGAGTQNAALAFGGYVVLTCQTIELFNGTSWSAGGANMITRRYGSAGAGTQNAALAFGGAYSAACPQTEAYNGTSWASGGNLITARGTAGAGTQNEALAMGGGSPGTATEEYNGTSWSAGGAMIVGRGPTGAGIQNAALAFGGGVTAPVGNATEAYNGTSWSIRSSMIIARNSLAGAGTQDAALAFSGCAPTSLSCTEAFSSAAVAIKTFDYSNTTGNVSATGSLFGTSSFATTASFALNAGGSGFPFIGIANITGSLFISSSSPASSSLGLRGSGSVFTVDGTSGRLFSVDDSLSGSLFSVNTAAGLPVIEAFSDNTVRIGQYSRRELFVSQSVVGINKETALNGVLDISGSVIVSGSISVSGSVINNLTASFATNVIPITSKTMVIGNNNYIQPYDTGSFVSWRIPFPITASSITAYSTSSLGPTSGSQVNANKNGSLLLATPLAVTTSTWVSSSTLQNQNFNTGDVLGFNFLTLTGSLTQIVIQVDFIK